MRGTPSRYASLTHVFSRRIHRADLPYPSRTIFQSLNTCPQSSSNSAQVVDVTDKDGTTCGVESALKATVHFVALAPL
jgi:hypothetical protein